MLRGAKVGDLFMKLIHLPIMSRQLIRLRDGVAAPCPGIDGRTAAWMPWNIAGSLSRRAYDEFCLAEMDRLQRRLDDFQNGR